MGWRGIAVLTGTGVAGILLAVHGWAGRGSGGTPSLAAGPAPPRASAGSGSPAGAASGSPAPASPPAARQPGPLLRSEPYASASFQVWPGPQSAAAKRALTGLSVSVRRLPAGLSVTAGVAGQAPGPARRYASGARVYIVETSMGDDSGSSDYNLGDDGLIVTDRQGRITR